jgi:threonine dehydratase
VTHRVTIENIEAAVKKIDPVFLNSPQFRADALDADLGCELIVKVETVNPIRCFKGRGACTTIASLEPGTKVICASAGNFGQAMAYAATRRGIDLTVFASVNANPLKIARMRALGANLVLTGADFDEAKLESKRVAEETGVLSAEDGLQPTFAEGAGTMAMELLRWPEKLDAVLVPLGNGALLAGVAHWIKAHSPSTEVIAISAEGAPAMVESWRTGTIVEYDTVSTISDGIGVRVPIPEAVEELRGIVDDAILVSDETTVRAMKLIHQRVGTVVEPSGATGTAAILENRERFAGKRVATIFTGGNLPDDLFAKWIGTQA